MDLSEQKFGHIIDAHMFISDTMLKDQRLTQTQEHFLIW